MLLTHTARQGSVASGDKVGAIAASLRNVSFEGIEEPRFISLTSKRLLGHRRLLERNVGLNAGDAAQVSLGESLARQGRLFEAEQAFRQAVALDPENAQTVLLLARCLLAMHKPAEASRILETFIDSSSTEFPDILLLHAQALLSMGHFDKAIPAFQRATAAAPDDGAAALGLAVAFGESGNGEGAAVAAQHAIAKGLDTPSARFVLGRAFCDTHRFDEAESEFRRVLSLQPAHTSAHTMLAELIWMRTGDAGAACRLLDAILCKALESIDLRVLKGRLLNAAGHVEQAYAELAIGLNLQRNNADLHVEAARIAMQFDPARARMHAERALQIAPAQPRTMATHADTLLAGGHAVEALSVAEKLLHANPGDGHAIAVQASAWRMLGDPRYLARYDYRSFVRASELDTPEGWDDLASYLQDLASSLHRRHQWFRAHPVRQTLRSGTRVELRAEQSEDPAIRAFTRAIDGPIHRYLREIGGGNDVLRRRNTGSYRIPGMWSVRLRNRGHHVNHVHGQGWLSSACYIEIPDASVSANDSGWLKFGEPGVSGTPTLPADYFVKPEAGQLVLFPSWMWHGTVPLSGSPSDTRLSIAFDVVPA